MQLDASDQKKEGNDENEIGRCHLLSCSDWLAGCDTRPRSADAA
jgi:hypothetical protein